MNQHRTALEDFFNEKEEVIFQVLCTKFYRNPSSKFMGFSNKHPHSLPQFYNRIGLQCIYTNDILFFIHSQHHRCYIHISFPQSSPEEIAVAIRPPIVNFPFILLKFHLVFSAIVFLLTLIKFKENYFKKIAGLNKKN